ncbi:MAG: LysR family transcriptional regulator [Polaromonas sp.]|uniref:LysR family transcriptional regulator n=1 Tax=Polaromonas sp. TaxID=1869339 RepID=UPI0025DECC47|nr:LysR family transcriptional regulator [Polaromonas sp.]MBI2725175.1 LysR family transcriptional regulator [Polaromonas sp.]
MKLNSLDLNLLLVFDAILRTESVTRAADDVGLSQPAMSNALTRLREYFNDQLFVRTQGSMQPTPLALRLGAPVQEALLQLRQALEDKRHFDAQTSTRCFRVCMTEVAQRVFLPQLMSSFQTVAPGVQLATVDMFPDHTQVALGTGEIDLAIGYFADFGPNFYAQRIFQENYVVMLRRGHAATSSGSLTLEAYLDASHIVYLPAAASHHTLEAMLDTEFAKHGVKRRVGLRVAHSMGLSSIVAGTDLVLTIPSRLGQAFSGLVDVQLFDLPLDVPRIDINQYWHARFHQDPAIQWLRSQFQANFQG